MSSEENLRRDPHLGATSPTCFDDIWCRHFLLTHQNADGGWGYHPGASSGVEVTSWALIALGSHAEDASAREASERGRDWLLKAQLADGSWPAFPGQTEGCWTTSLASRALQVLGAAPEAVVRGRDWLLRAWPAEGGIWWRLVRRWRGHEVVRQDSSLRGWSWTPHTASWVEPTAHALLFLNTLPPELLSPLAEKRRLLAERMLYDRMCPGGGWNSGNPLVYGVAGLPRIGPTSWALLALARFPERPEIQLSLDWLERAARNARGPASLAVASYCLATYGRRVETLGRNLAELYRHNRFFDNLLTAAWTALALGDAEQRSGGTQEEGVPR